MSGADATGWADFGKLIGQAIALVAGWWVVHRLSTLRDHDKSRREMVSKSADQLIDALSSHLVDAHKYHLAARSIEAELKIKMSLQDMAMRAVGLSDIVRNEALLAPCRTEIAAVRRAVTGKHFEDEHDGPLEEASNQVQAIAEAVLRAKRAFLRLKHHQFTAQ